MIRIQRHDDVERLTLSHARSRLIGMSVSMFMVRGVLVDSGFPAIGASLETYLGGVRVRGACITHRHEDHAGNVERLARRGLPIRLGAATLASLREPRPIALYRRFTWGTPPPLTSPIVPFDDPELQLLATPGHSADHHVVWDAREGTLFSGDLFLGVKVAVAHASERPRQLVRSLRAVISLGPRRMFDAHRGLVDRPVSALEAKVAWMEDRLGRIDALHDRGWTDAAVRQAVLRREGLPGLVSGGEYSKRNFVAAARRERTAVP